MAGQQTSNHSAVIKAAGVLPGRCGCSLVLLWPSPECCWERIRWLRSHYKPSTTASCHPEPDTQSTSERSGGVSDCSKLTWTTSSLTTVSSVLFLASKPNLQLANRFDWPLVSALKHSRQSERHLLAANQNGSSMFLDLLTALGR